MTNRQQRFMTDLPDIRCEFDRPLAEMTYFKIGGPAEIFVEVAELDTIQAVLSWASNTGCPVTILGGASNIIVADQGISGLVLKITSTGVRNNGNLLTAEAGVKTALLVSQSIEYGLTGLEYFLGVPGTLGGAILNNAHYLQHLIGEYVNRVQVITLEGEAIWLDKEECEFSYDHSRFQSSKEIIWVVEFVLDKGSKEISQALITEATQYRAKTQPLGEPSSGCIFQNVTNTDVLRRKYPEFSARTQVPAGFLIDHAGLKGTRVGGAEVSHKHAAFMVNKGGATAKDVKELIQLVKQKVLADSGVHLQEEVFYLGETI